MPEVVFLFIGGGARRKEIEQQAKLRGLRSIMFKPYQPQARLSESLAAADVHLVSLLPEIEGLVVPSKVYGTMAVARPTLFVGDRNGEVAQLVARHGSGFSVGIGEADDSATLAVGGTGSGSAKKRGSIRSPLTEHLAFPSG